jgi:hypothetical protein
MDVKCLRPISTQGNFSGKKNFQIGWKKCWSWKFSTFNNDIFGTFSVRGNFSWVEMDLQTRTRQATWIHHTHTQSPSSAQRFGYENDTTHNNILHFFRLLNRFLRRKQVWLYWVKVIRYRILMNYYNVRSNFTWILSAWRKVVYYEKFVK